MQLAGMGGMAMNRRVWIIVVVAVVILIAIDLVFFRNKIVGTAPTTTIPATAPTLSAPAQPTAPKQ